MARHKAQLSVAIYTEEGGLVWQGKALSVSSTNSQGPFDILPQHANFITIVRGKPIVVRTIAGEQKTDIYEQAVLYIRDDAVEIFAVSDVK